MPTLDWEGKSDAIRAAEKVPCCLLEFDSATSCGDDDNLIVQGDNLHVMQSLLPFYRDRVKCIYIDPPYNTHSAFEHYDDNFEHSAWLSMMYPRLELLRDFLSEDGAIFISIDDTEQAYLKVICDEIFGRNNFVDIFSWKKTETPANLSLKTKKAIEYIICYTKTNTSIKFRGLSKNSKSNNGLMNQSNVEKELIFPAHIVDTSLPDGIYPKKEYGTKSYKIFLLEDTEVKNGYFIKPVKLYGKFKWSQTNLNKELERKTKISIKTIAFSPSYEKTEYAPEVPWNIIDKSFGVQTNEMASAELRAIFDGEKVFEFPKPPSLIEYLINFICDKNSLVLDAFAGSGTTAHAVINLNNQDGGNRKFILIEEKEYCKTITAERVKRVGGSFKFYRLGAGLFDETGLINPLVTTRQLAAYIWLKFTGAAYQGGENLPLIGIHEGAAYYLLREEILTREVLETLPPHEGEKIIFGVACRISADFLLKNKITFNQLPTKIKA